jgi:hypothetical protein
VAAAIGDLIKTNVAVSIPSGETYIDEITLRFQDDVNDISSVITNLISSTFSFGADLTYSDDGVDSTTLSVTPYAFGNSLVFPVKKLFRNDGSGYASLTFQVDYTVKNLDLNIRGRDLTTGLTMKTYNTQGVDYIQNAQTPTIDFTIVEPGIDLQYDLSSEVFRWRAIRTGL